MTQKEVVAVFALLYRPYTECALLAYVPRLRRLRAAAVAGTPMFPVAPFAYEEPDALAAALVLPMHSYRVDGRLLFSYY